MKEEIKNSKLIVEEKKTFKLFLWLFYIVFFSYDLFYYFIYPKSLNKKPGFPEGGLGYWYYPIIFFFIPLAIYGLKKGNPYIIKYLYFYGYTLVDMLRSILIYWGSHKHLAYGSLVEILFVFFSPLFVNKKFFYTVSAGMIIKYVLLGVLLRDTGVITPIWLLIFISMASYVFLIRFISYVKAINSVNDELRQKEKLAVI